MILLKLRLRLGRRGAALLLMSAIWGIIGFSLIVQGDRPPDGTLHGLIPYQIRGLIWLLSAGLAFVCAWGKNHDWTGFGFLMLMPLIRVFSYLWSWIIFLVTGGQGGYSNGLLASALYGALVGLVYLTAGWPEPREE